MGRAADGRARKNGQLFGSCLGMSTHHTTHSIAFNYGYSRLQLQYQGLKCLQNTRSQTHTSCYQISSIEHGYEHLTSYTTWSGLTQARRHTKRWISASRYLSRCQEEFREVILVTCCRTDQLEWAARMKTEILTSRHNCPPHFARQVF